MHTNSALFDRISSSVFSPFHLLSIFLRVPDIDEFCSLYSRNVSLLPPPLSSPLKKIDQLCPVASTVDLSLVEILENVAMVVATVPFPSDQSSAFVTVTFVISDERRAIREGQVRTKCERNLGPASKDLERTKSGLITQEICSQFRRHPRTRPSTESPSRCGERRPVHTTYQKPGYLLSINDSVMTARATSGIRLAPPNTSVFRGQNCVTQCTHAGSMYSKCV